MRFFSYTFLKLRLLSVQSAANPVYFITWFFKTIFIQDFTNMRPPVNVTQTSKVRCTILFLIDIKFEEAKTFFSGYMETHAPRKKHRITPAVRRVERQAVSHFYWQKPCVFLQLPKCRGARPLSQACLLMNTSNYTTMFYTIKYSSVVK